MTNTKDKIKLKAQKRSITGSKVKVLREAGMIPAVIYGKGMEAINLEVPVKDFTKILQQAGESTLVYLDVDGKDYPTIIHDVSRGHLNSEVVHADFYKVNLDEKIKAMIPVIFEGESPAVKNLGGVFVRNINEIEVEALPQNLPHEIRINVSILANFDDQVSFKDVDLGSDVKIIGEADSIIATIQAPMSEEELKKSIEGESADVSQVEIVEKKKEEEASGAEEPETEKSPS